MRFGAGKICGCYVTVVTANHRIPGQIEHILERCTVSRVSQMYSFGDVTRLPAYGRDDKLWLYDQTIVAHIVLLERGVVRNAQRLRNWLEKDLAA